MLVPPATLIVSAITGPWSIEPPSRVKFVFTSSPASKVAPPVTWPHAEVTSELPVEFAQQPATNVSTLQPPFAAHVAALVGSFHEAGVQPPQPEGFPPTPPQIDVPPWIVTVPVK